MSERRLQFGDEVILRGVVAFGRNPYGHIGIHIVDKAGAAHPAFAGLARTPVWIFDEWAEVVKPKPLRVKVKPEVRERVRVRVRKGSR